MVGVGATVRRLRGCLEQPPPLPLHRNPHFPVGCLPCWGPGGTWYVSPHGRREHVGQRGCGCRPQSCREETASRCEQHTPSTHIASKWECFWCYSQLPKCDTSSITVQRPSCPGNRDDPHTDLSHSFPRRETQGVAMSCANLSLMVITSRTVIRVSHNVVEKEKEK